MFRLVALLLFVPAIGYCQESCATIPGAPYYPQIARAARVSGTVELEVKFDATDHKAASVNVISGHPMLKEAAQQAVQQWRYSGKSPARVRVRFVLEGEEAYDDCPKITFAYPEITISRHPPQMMVNQASPPSRKKQ